MNYIKGLDSRYWNGILPPDYEDFKFAGIKISQGTSHAGIDYTMPRKQWKLCPEQNLNRLPFHFWKGSRTQDPKQHGIAQAEFFYETVMSLNQGMGELPPAIDCEDTWAYKGLRSLVDIYECCKRTKELWNKPPIIYTASWWWNQCITPYDDYDGGKYRDIYSYKLWEADPPPDTPEPGDWTKDDLAVIQVELDASYPGFSASIDIDWAIKEWYDEQITPPNGEKSIVDISYDSSKVEIILIEK